MGQMYQGGIQSMLDGLIRGGLTAHLVGATYEPQLGVDQTVGDIAASAARSSVSIQGATAADGKLRVDKIVFPAVSGRKVTGVVISTFDGRLLSYSDEGFPVDPIGTDIIVTFDGGIILSVG